MTRPRPFQGPRLLSPSSGSLRSSSPGPAGRRGRLSRWREGPARQSRCPVARPAVLLAVSVALGVARRRCGEHPDLAGPHGLPSSWPRRSGLFHDAAGRGPGTAFAVVVARPLSGLSVGVTAMVLPAVAAVVVGSQAIASVTADTAAAAPRPVAAGASDADPLPVRRRRSGHPDGRRCAQGHPALSAGLHRRAQGHGVTRLRHGPAGRSGTAEQPARGADRRLHAGTWYPAVARVARLHHWTVEVLTSPGCPLPQIRVINDQVGRAFTECDTWRASTLTRLQSEPRPRLVFVATLNRYVGDDSYLMSGWAKTLTTLKGLGAPLVYLRDTPFPGKDIPSCVSGALRHWSQLRLPPVVRVPRRPVGRWHHRRFGDRHPDGGPEPVPLPGLAPLSRGPGRRPALSRRLPPDRHGDDRSRSRRGGPAGTAAPRPEPVHGTQRLVTHDDAVSR